MSNKFWLCVPTLSLCYQELLPIKINKYSVVKISLAFFSLSLTKFIYIGTQIADNRNVFTIHYSEHFSFKFFPCPVSCFQYSNRMLPVAKSICTLIIRQFLYQFKRACLNHCSLFEFYLTANPDTVICGSVTPSRWQTFSGKLIQVTCQFSRYNTYLFRMIVLTPNILFYLFVCCTQVNRIFPRRLFHNWGAFPTEQKRKNLVQTCDSVRCVKQSPKR